MSQIGEYAAGFADPIANLVISGSVPVCEAVTDALGSILGATTAQALMSIDLYSSVMLSICPY